MVGNYYMRGEINQIVAGSLQIGPVKVPNRVILAPMSGITDAPFRRLTERHGAGLVVPEPCSNSLEGLKYVSMATTTNERPSIVYSRNFCKTIV